MQVGGVTIKWLGHAGFLLEKEDLRIYIDPYQIGRGRPDADLVLITHNHYDHLSVEDLDRIATEDTVYLCPDDCMGKLEDIPGELRIVKSGKELSVKGVDIEVVAAYNKGKKFHPKESGWVGYILDIDGTRFYHVGDSDVLDEMEGVEVDVVFLPVSGTYVMTAAEAAEATKRIKAKQAVPMHWGSFIGERSDAEEFEKKAACDVVILPKE